MRKFFIKLLGGYHEGEVLNEVISEVYKTVHPEDILRRNEKGELTLEDKPIPKEILVGLKEQADALLKSRLFKTVEREFRHRTNVQLRKATTIEQHENALLLEYTWDVVETILKNIKNI